MSKIFLSYGALVGIYILGNILVSNSETDKGHDYEQRLNELNRWYQKNAEAISFGQFYRENYPKNYRE